MRNLRCALLFSYLIFSAHTLSLYAKEHDKKQRISHPSQFKIIAPNFAKSKTFEIIYTKPQFNTRNLQRIHLFYKVGHQKEWTYFGEDKDLKSPFLFKAQQDGVYQFYLAAKYRYQKEIYPSIQSHAQLRCLVDTSKPVVQLLNLKGSHLQPRGANKKQLIRWNAHDENILERPISLDWSYDNGLTWKNIFTPLYNSGEYVWTIPKGFNVKKTLIRVSAQDIVGNIGADISSPFEIDGTPCCDMRIDSIRPLPESWEFLENKQFENVKEEQYPEYVKYRKRAMKGDAKAQYKIAIMHDIGFGIQENQIEAYKWYTIAALNGIHEGYERRQDKSIGYMLKNKDNFKRLKKIILRLYEKIYPGQDIIVR